MLFGAAFGRPLFVYDDIVFHSTVTVLFLFEEYLNTDTGKIEIIKKVRYKILDFIYYAIFQYSIIDVSIIKPATHS